MISIVRFILVGCAFLLSLDRVSGEEALTINLRDVPADSDRVYSINLPSKKYLNFTAVRPESSCWASVNPHTNVTFMVGGDDDNCSMTLFWSSGGATFAQHTRTGLEFEKTPTLGDIEFSLSSRGFLTGVFANYKNVSEVYLYYACEFRATRNFDRTYTMNFTVKPQDANAFPPECTEMLFKFAPGIVLSSPSADTTLNAPTTGALSPIASPTFRAPTMAEPLTTIGLQNMINVSTTIALQLDNVTVSSSPNATSAVPTTTSVKLENSTRPPTTVSSASTADVPIAITSTSGEPTFSASTLDALTITESSTAITTDSEEMTTIGLQNATRLPTLTSTGLNTTATTLSGVSKILANVSTTTGLRNATNVWTTTEASMTETTKRFPAAARATPMASSPLSSAAEVTPGANYLVIALCVVSAIMY